MIVNGERFHSPTLCARETGRRLERDTRGTGKACGKVPSLQCGGEKDKNSPLCAQRVDVGRGRDVTMRKCHGAGGASPQHHIYCDI